MTHVTSNRTREVLLLSRSDVERLLPPDECITAVEDCFRLHATGKAPAPGILALHVNDGSLHVKAGSLTVDEPYFAAKLNANFPQNGGRYGLPTIQGLVVLSDAANGRPLAVMDSMSITALRTAAASAVAAKYLAREHCEDVLLCGCGSQAAAQLAALLRVRRVERIRVYDQDASKAKAFAATHEAQTGIVTNAVEDLSAPASKSQIIITCTTARRHFLERDMVRPGTFIAAVGADDEDKQEIDPMLLATSIVVADLIEQCAVIGDLHHAVEAGLMSHTDVHAELGEVIAGTKPGRTSEDQIIVFDSTGTALQDVAAAAVVYRRAIASNEATRFGFAA